MVDPTGQQLGSYVLLKEIASGAFGSVHLAQHHILTERLVAIKILHAYLRSSQEREQLIQEAHFLEQLRHPHILALLDVGISENKLYLVTPYAAGGSLRDRLKKNIPRLLPLEQSIRILMQIGQTLQYAHQKNIIHRDLKPENILFTAEGDVLLADFGIATMLSTVSMKYVTVIGGTPPYMAPEQFQGHISKESDQYALGCIAYELFTGQLPFSAPDFVSMGFKHATQSPVALTALNPSLPSFLEQAVLKAMAKQRSERYPDITSFIAALSPSPPPIRYSTTSQENIPTVLSSRLHPRTYNPERAEKKVTPQKHLSANVQPSSQRHLVGTTNPQPISKTQTVLTPRWKQLLHFAFICLEILLLLRFLGRLFGAYPDNQLVSFVYALSQLFVALFNGIFNDYVIGQRGVFELSTLVAMASYGLIFWIVLRRLGINILGRRVR